LVLWVTFFWFTQRTKGPKQLRVGSFVLSTI
jgi:hypothetical protein